MYLPYILSKYYYWLICICLTYTQNIITEQHYHLHVHSNSTKSRQKINTHKFKIFSTPMSYKSQNCDSSSASALDILVFPSPKCLKPPGNSSGPSSMPMAFIFSYMDHHMNKDRGARAFTCTWTFTSGPTALRRRLPNHQPPFYTDECALCQLGAELCSGESILCPVLMRNGS